MYNVQLIHSFHCFEFIELTLLLMIIRGEVYLHGCKITE